MATPKQTDPQFKLRLPADLKHQIDRAAEENNRSINAEIVARLEASAVGGGAGAEEWRKRFQDEHDAYVRLEALYENAYGLAMSYKDLLRSTKGRMLHIVSTLNSLASIIRSEGPMRKDVVDLARRVEAESSKEKALLEVELELVEGRSQPDDIEGLLKRAGAPSNKPE